MQIFGAGLDSPWQCMDCLGSFWCNLCNKLCFCVYETENDHGMWFRKEEPMSDEWAAHGQPTCSVLGLLKQSQFV